VLISVIGAGLPARVPSIRPIVRNAATLAEKNALFAPSFYLEIPRKSASEVIRVPGKYRPKLIIVEVNVIIAINYRAISIIISIPVIIVIIEY